MNTEARSLFMFLSAVLIPAAIANMYLYWISFDVNPFMFFGSTDVFSIVVPFAMHAGVILSGAYISIFIAPTKADPHPDQKGLKKVVVPIWLISLALCIGTFLYKELIGHDWAVLVFMGTLGANAVFFKELLRLEEWRTVFSNELSIRTAAFTLVYAPLIAVFLAYESWHDITGKESFNYISPSSLSNGALSEYEYLPVLGKIGSKYVLSTPGFQETVFVESSSLDIVRMKKHEPKE